MAEIRSTMEMVLERAARLEAEAGNSLSTEEKSQEGMRLAAQYMRGEELDFTHLLAKPEAPSPPSCAISPCQGKGMTRP